MNYDYISYFRNEQMYTTIKMMPQLPHSATTIVNISLTHTNTLHYKYIVHTNTPARSTPDYH